jgi:thiosulfate dehydrogenase [quinone] large subunit
MIADLSEGESLAKQQNSNCNNRRSIAMNATIMRWFERLTIVLSALALLIVFVSLPNTPATAWGWFVFATGIFALGIAGAAALMHRRSSNQTRQGSFLFSHVNASSLWLVVRVYLGSIWLQAGLSKLFDPGWRGGQELKGFWAWVVYTPTGPHPQVAYTWYHDLLQSMLVHQTYSWFAWVITLGELSTGILLILGLFTGLAAFAGAGLNLLYLFAGSAGINPVMLILSIFLLMAWRVAGYYGLDRFVLPAIMARAGRQIGKRGIRTSARSAPNINGQGQASALSLEDLHGFE